MSLLWINGQLIDKAEARVSPFDHGFLYGDGVWEPLRVFGGQLFRPDEHLALLWDAAATLGIDIPLSRAELLAAIEATVRANSRTEGYVRVIVTRGPGTIGPDPRKLDPQVFITAEEYLPFPLELYDHGLHVVSAPTRLDPGNPAHRWRTLGQLHVVLAKQHALAHGCLEAVWLDPHGTVTGGTEGPFFLVADGRIRYPNPGRDATADVAAGLATATPGPVALDDLRTADEVFLAGTSCGIIGVVRVDGKPIGTGTEGPITRQIRQAYYRLTRGEPGESPGTAVPGLSNG